MAQPMGIRMTCKVVTRRREVFVGSHAGVVRGWPEKVVGKYFRESFHGML